MRANIISSDGFEISGKLEDFSPGMFDSLRFYVDDEIFISSCKIAADGSFKLKVLTGPPLSLLDKVAEGFESVYDDYNNLSFSDSTALVRIQDCRIEGMAQGNDEAEIYNVNDIAFNLLNSDYSTPSNGAVFIEYWYSTKPVKIKGTGIVDYSDVKFVDIYDISLKKGWNKVSALYNETKEGDVEIYTSTYTNNIPTGLKWVYSR